MNQDLVYRAEEAKLAPIKVKWHYRIPVSTNEERVYGPPQDIKQDYDDENTAVSMGYTNVTFNYN